MKEEAVAVVPMTLRLEVPLSRAIRKEASERKMALNDLCEEALWEHIRRYKAIHEQEGVR